MTTLTSWHECLTLSEVFLSCVVLLWLLLPLPPPPLCDWVRFFVTPPVNIILPVGWAYLLSNEYFFPESLIYLSGLQINVGSKMIVRNWRTWSKFVFYSIDFLASYLILSFRWMIKFLTSNNFWITIIRENLCMEL